MSASAITTSPPSVTLGKRPREPDTDYSKPLPYPPSEPAVEAMRLRILELENEVRALKKRKTTSAAAPQQATLTAFAGSSKTPASASSAPPPAAANAKTIKARTKSLFDQIKKAAKAEKYQNVTRTVRVEDHFSQADFDLVFGAGGTLVQPTPSNKPTSKVWIRHYAGDTSLAALFADAWKPEQLKGHQWSRGSIFVGKGQKLGQVDLRIREIEVQWSKNTEKTTLKVDVCEKHLAGCGDSDGGWDF